MNRISQFYDAELSRPPPPPQQTISERLQKSWQCGFASGRGEGYYHGLSIGLALGAVGALSVVAILAFGSWLTH